MPNQRKVFIENLVIDNESIKKSRAERAVWRDACWLVEAVKYGRDPRRRTGKPGGCRFLGRKTLRDKAPHEALIMRTLPGACIKSGHCLEDPSTGPGCPMVCLNQKMGRRVRIKVRSGL